MIISEKQILQLIRIAEGFSHMLHQVGQYKQSEVIQDLVFEINEQQSKELKAIE